MTLLAKCAELLTPLTVPMKAEALRRAKLYLYHGGVYERENEETKVERHSLIAMLANMVVLTTWQRHQEAVKRAVALAVTCHGHKVIELVNIVAGKGGKYMFMSISWGWPYFRKHRYLTKP